MIQRVDAGRSLAHGVITDLAATISEQIGRGVTSIQMDASRVVEFDSQSLEGLLEFNELAKTRGLSFVILEPSELLATAISITGIEDRLEIADNSTTNAADADADCGEPARSSDGQAEPGDGTDPMPGEGQA